MNRLTTELLPAFVFLFLTAINVYADDIIISDALIAEAPPVAGMNAGYLYIENSGIETVTLLSVASPDFSRIEIHKTTTENNITRMELVDSVEIHPGDTLLFQPGDFHLMLYNNRRTLTSGDIVSLTFTFSGDLSKDIDAQVRKVTGLHQTHAHRHEETTGYAMFDKIKVYYQYLLPQHFLSGLIYRLTRSTWAPLKNFMISTFIRMYHVDMTIAAISDPRQYRHFNDFFTRALLPSARPIDPSPVAMVSPVDGAVSQYGSISGDSIIQAKGRDYSVSALLGGDLELADSFTDGEFITIYLSPRDYHRIHMPVTGELESMTYVPGDLFSVNTVTTRNLDNLFARNERIVHIFETEIGKVALVMVGAIFVGSMETVWGGEITPASERKQYTVSYGSNGQPRVKLEKGEEMGRFNMGSTVILLFEKDRIEWDSWIQPDLGVVLGRKLAEFQL